MPHNRWQLHTKSGPMTRRMALRRAGMISASVALAPVLHACGDEETEATFATPDEETVTAPRTTLEPLATPATPGATPGATPAGPTTHLVKMNNQLNFVPAELTLRVGDTVVWRTVGSIPHTSTCDEDEANQPEEHVARPEGAEPWNSGLVGQGEEFERTFDVAGEYTYFCIPHEGSGMIGYLTVKE